MGEAMLALRRILVPTDFSPASDLAVDYAVGMAGRSGGAVEVLHVVDVTSLATALAQALGTDRPDLRDRLIGEAERRLAEVRAKCASSQVSASSHVLTGQAARAIAERAFNSGADLIVMGTHGRSGVAHLVLGSVAERVLRIAPCPVLVVRDTRRVADILAVSPRETDDARAFPPPRE
jgi:nucleotide-binding universal stress UspA family protein